jgi:uncharacterized damage-inducible protein DinB
MNKTMMAGFWDHFRTMHGVTVRCVEAIPKDKLDARPCKDMRTAKELVTHMYAQMRFVTDGVPKGHIAYTDANDPAEMATIKNHDDLVRYAKESWEIADRKVKSLTDAQLEAIVQTEWGGLSFPGWVCIHIVYDEHLHHRGQLYAFLRQLGVEPPFLWDFEHNAPEYRPKQTQQA